MKGIHQWRISQKYKIKKKWHKQKKDEVRIKSPLNRNNQKGYKLTSNNHQKRENWKKVNKVNNNPFQK